jgi:hypothetical protein
VLPIKQLHPGWFYFYNPNPKSFSRTIGKKQTNQNLQTVNSGLSERNVKDNVKNLKNNIQGT